MRKSKKLSLSAMLLAFTIIALYLAAVFPTMSLTIIAISGLLAYLAIIECGVKWAGLMYGAASILSLLIVPDKSCAIMYIMLFGIYSFIKYFSEKISNRALSWCVKLVSVNGLILFLYFFFKELLLSFAPERILVIFAYIVFNAVFVMFDICITRLKVLYMWRVHRHID